MQTRRLTWKERARWFVMRQNRHVVMVALLVLILVANFVGSVLIPYGRYVLVTEPQWAAESSQGACGAPDAHCVPPIPREMVWESLLHEYALDMTFTLVGYYLTIVPVAWLASRSLFWFPWQPFVWLAAVAAVPLSLRLSGPLPKVWRVVYAFLTAILMSGFLARHWSTLGD